MLDFNLGLELVAVLATLVYLALLIAENMFPEDGSESQFPIFQSERKYKKSLLGQHIAFRQ